MSFLTLQENLPLFTQCIISFWVRVPQASIDTADNRPSDGSQVVGLIPFITMGKAGAVQTSYSFKQTPTLWSTSATWIAEGQVDVNFPSEETCIMVTAPYDDTPPPVVPWAGGWAHLTAYWSRGAEWVLNKNPDIMGAYWSIAQSDPQPIGPPPPQPTMIGFQSGNLYVNFETTKKPDVQNKLFALTGVVPGSLVTTSLDAANGAVIGTCFTQGPYEDYHNPWGYNCTWYVGSTIVVVDGRVGVCSPLEGQDGEFGSASTFMPPTQIYTDATYTVWDDVTDSVESSTINLTADEWHHVLVSVNLLPMTSTGRPTVDTPINPQSQWVTGFSKLYIAVDDFNYTKGDLSESWLNGSDNNDVISVIGSSIAGDTSFNWAPLAYDPMYGFFRPFVPPRPNTYGIPSYSNHAPSVPAGPVGIPARITEVEEIQRIEMAELQMWLGRTLDFGIEANRRLFIDYRRDSHGNKVPENDGTFRLYPIPPERAAAMLGTPDIMLHGSDNWIKGIDTGSRGVGSDGKPIHGGQFTPTALIREYKPDPSCLPGTGNPPQ